MGKHKEITIGLEERLQRAAHIFAAAAIQWLFLGAAMGRYFVAAAES